MRRIRGWGVGLVILVGAGVLAGPAHGAESVAPGPPPLLWQEGQDAVVHPDLVRINLALAELIDRLRPALVQIRVRRAAPEGQPEEGPRRSLGSGFLVTQDGYVVTNAHVVGRDTEVQVRLASGRRFKGTVVGRDPRVDLALVKVEGEGFPVLPLGDSEAVKVGELVLALGHPFGLEQTVSLGIVSRKGAPLLAAAPGFDFIQTDAAVNPGNSGGPLVNVAGQVVGVNTMAARNGSIRFAIPVNLVKGLLPQLLAKGKAEWGWLGVGIEEITEENATEFGLTEPRGVAIHRIIPGQPAEQGGIRAKDVVVAVDGLPVGAPRELQRIIATTPVGKTIRLTLLREGKETEVAVTVGLYPEGGPEPAAAPPKPEPPKKEPPKPE
ncbi:MAG: trypsin-like peptidase domain-containing protein [Candidatus Rokubacteria bacterium]|nr:trypsin-like peptidase domain-containing protein [Candidatus Rokubacteria bacterium]